MAPEKEILLRTNGCKGVCIPKRGGNLASEPIIARKVQEDWEAEEKVKKLVEEEATNAALIQDFDDIKARIEADRLLALRAAAIRNRPPTRTQLRCQMMTYLKHVGNKKHSDLKNKTFEEIQALYEKVKKFDKSFTVISSTEDERKIKEMNEGASDPDKKKKFIKKDVLTKVPAKPDIAEQGTKKRKGGHIKMLARKRKRPQPDIDSDDEHIKCLKIVTFKGTIDSEIMERKYVITRLNKVSSPVETILSYLRANRNFRAFNINWSWLSPLAGCKDLFSLGLTNSQIRKLSREVAISISWNDFKFMVIQEFFPSHEIQKLESELWNHDMVGAGHVAYTDRFHELARLVPHLVTLESRMIERYVYGLALQIHGMVVAMEPKIKQISSALTDEAVRNGSIKKVEKRGNVGETSKDKNGRDDNKRTRTGNIFSTTVNPI
ncbi:reverse transcriptase domain-containing protein [Tanacetum coccineum]